MSKGQQNHIARSTIHPSPEQTSTSSSRRRFLRTGASTAAGAAAGAILAGTGTADAANGDPLKIGQFQTGTADTTLSGSKLKATHAGNNVTALTGESSGSNGMGVLGLASGTTAGVGVRGQGRTGVSGDGNFPNGIGVSGYGPTGVQGESPANNGVGVSGKATGASSTGVSGIGTNVGVFGEGSVAGVSAFSTTGEAVYAFTEGNDKAGVRAVGGLNGAGVYGTASGPSSTGVGGLSDGAGVFGEGGVSGVSAFSNTGDAFYGHTDGSNKAAAKLESSSGVGAHIDAPTSAAIRLEQGPAMPPTTGVWKAGDIVRRDGLWFCLVGGTGSASKWTKLSRTYQPLASPKRIYDSRPGYEPAGVTKGKLSNGQERVVDATFGGAVPPGIASAVEVNLTVVDTDSGGWLSLFSNAVSWPGTSTINWFMAGMTIANGATVAVDALARFKVRAAGSTNFVVDVTGYYT